jgi:hypothetical protein
MAMTDQEEKDLRSYCATLLKEYGFQFTPDNPEIPVLYIIHKELQLNSENNKAIASLVQEVASRINPTEFKFYSDGAAWKFQMGMTIRWLLIGLVFLMSIGVATWYRSMGIDVGRAKTILSASGKANELLKRARKDDEDYFYLDFTSTGENATQDFKEFKTLNVKTVRVYLGKDLK